MFVFCAKKLEGENRRGGEEEKKFEQGTRNDDMRNLRKSNIVNPCSLFKGV